MSSVPSRKVIERLANEIAESGLMNLIPKEDADAIAEALRGSSGRISVVLYVPRTVKASVAGRLADLAHARCSRCGKVHNLRSISGRPTNTRCNCGGSLIPTPVWCISARKLPPNSDKRITSSEEIKMVMSIEDYSKLKRVKARIKAPAEKELLPEKVLVSDRSRPLASMQFVYPNGAHLVPDFVVEAPNNFEYLLSPMPLESITKPVTVTAFAYDEKKCIDLKATTRMFQGIEKILFCSDLEVLQATVIYKAGHPRSSSRDRVSVLHMSRFLNLYQIHIPIRHVSTKGIVIKADSDRLKDVAVRLGYEEEFVARWVALHTICHAFLVNLPRVTGLEGGDFGEAISTNTWEVAIYDNSPGGLGGVEGVVHNGNLAPNYEWSIRDAHRCPLACVKACKACLYTESCYMLNWRLDRRILRDLGW